MRFDMDEETPLHGHLPLASLSITLMATLRIGRLVCESQV